jgi:predicted permease
MWSNLLFRLRAIFRRDAMESELDEELRLHREQHVMKSLRAGLTREEAERRVRQQFGGLDQVKEECRDARGVNIIETALQDVRYALRQLRKAPGFALTAIVTLALGIGANTAIFTLVHEILLKNLPVADPQALARIGDAYQCCVNDGAVSDGDYALFSTHTYEQWKKNNDDFEELSAMQAGFAFFNPLSTRRDGSERGSVRSSVGEFVSGNYFRMFGLHAAAGRLLQGADDVKGGSAVAVMSYDKWTKDYNDDPSVIGSTFWMNTKPVTIVGIAPNGFYGDRLTTAPPEFYLPMRQIATVEDAEFVDDPNRMWLYVIGRVKPGVNLARLQTKLSLQLRQLLAGGKSFSFARDRNLLDKAHVVVTAGGGGIQIMQLGYQSKLKLLMWISGLVLLIACLNIANLLLVRDLARRAEMSIRTALGAGRARMIRQLLTESVVLAILGGIAALGVSYLATRLLVLMAFPGEKSLPIDPAPSLTVLGFALGVSVLAGVLFGIAPALTAAGSEAADALRTGARTTKAGAARLQGGLIILQTALSLILLVGAALFANSLNKLQGIDMKLESKNRYILHIDPQAAGYLPSQVEGLYRTIEQRFHEVSVVLRVGISSVTPMEARNNNDPVQIQGKPNPHKMAGWNRVNAEYFDAVGTRLIAGRGINTQDLPSEPMVAVVNRAFVKTFFAPGENPIGARLGVTGDATIVGEVEDTAYTDVRMKNHAMSFVPILQRAASDKRPIDKVGALYAGAIVIQTAGPTSNMETIARKTLAGINPDLTVVSFQTFDQQIAAQFTQERMTSRLMTAFGTVALLLAAVGLYGVTSYTVARRSGEIGIRMALGSSRSEVIGMILRGALLQVLAGVALGVPLALMGVWPEYSHAIRFHG